MTIKLTEKQRDDLKNLLEDHQKVTDALGYVKRATWTRTLTIASEDGSDFFEVPLNYNFAKRVLTEQKDWLDEQIKKLGITL